MTIQCEWSPVVEDDVCRILGFTYFSVRNPCLVVVFVLFKKIQRFVLDPSPSLNTSLKLATSITKITPMHSLWDYVHGMIQHLNWRHRGEVQERKRGGTSDVTTRYFKYADSCLCCELLCIQISWPAASVFWDKTCAEQLYNRFKQTLLNCDTQEKQ